MHCKNCKYSDPTEFLSLQETFYCKYNPPRFYGSRNDSSGDKTKWSYPLVKPDDFCRHYCE